MDGAQGAAAARRPFGALLLTLANDQRLRLRDIWALAVAKAFFEPYGFGKLFSFFGYTARAVAAVRAASPALAGAPFDVYRPGRPYLLMSATMLGPRAQTVGGGGVKWKEQAFQSFVISPLYTAPVRALAARAGGVRARPAGRNISFLCARANSGCAGEGTHDGAAPPNGKEADRARVEVGGAWETHAFGAVAVAGGLRGSARGGGGGGGAAGTAPARLRVRLPATPFSLAQAAGISSSAAAAAVSAQPLGLPGKYCRLAHLAPAFSYASPLPAKPRAALMSWADGAVLDNFGIWPMLARGVGSVLLVVSAEQPLDPDLDVRDPQPAQLDRAFMALFGRASDKPNYQLFLYAQQQAFRPDGLPPLLEQLAAARRAGRPLLATGTATIVGTEHNGLTALDGRTVRLAVLYLSRVPEWEAKLACSAAPHLPGVIAQGSAPRCGSSCGPLKRFPHYATIRENEEVDESAAFDISPDYKLLSDKWTNMTDLTTLQVAALAHLQAYAARESAERIAAHFGLAPRRAGGGSRRGGGGGGATASARARGGGRSRAGGGGAAGLGRTASP